MPADEGADERTDRNNEKAAGLYVVEGSLSTRREPTPCPSAEGATSVWMSTIAPGSLR
jgi:hypothetical protein